MKMEASAIANRVTRSDGWAGSRRLVCTAVPTHVQYTSTNTIRARSRPAALCSPFNSNETWVMANTNTRSKNSSAQLTRLSGSPGSNRSRPAASSADPPSRAPPPREHYARRSRAFVRAPLVGFLIGRFAPRRPARSSPMKSVSLACLGSCAVRCRLGMAVRAELRPGPTRARSSVGPLHHVSTQGRFL